ncbi:alpha-2-macroglobulin family protein [Myxococcaceae bacterium GXIMD 01537]
MFSLSRLRVLAVPLAAVVLSLWSATALAQGKVLSWDQINDLIVENKIESAAQATEARLARARARKDEDEQVRALLRTAQLRIELGAYETAVRLMREEPPMKGAKQRALVNLFYASNLVTYVQQYSWEVRKRERVASKQAVDLKAWTYEEILTEAQRAYADVWAMREQLGGVRIEEMSNYLQANTYPRAVRGTLRDAVTHLYVDLLADTAHWRADHENGVYRLDLGGLLQGSQPVELLNPDIHPLVKLVALLEDLEAWHVAGGRRQAALDARLTRVERLHAAFKDGKDRERLREHLSTTIDRYRDVPWAAMGQGLLADLEAQAGHLVRAQRLARACVNAWPKSEGAARCNAVVQRLEQPSFSLEGMRADGSGKRSLEVRHRNLPALYFRAYAIDLERTLEGSDDYNLLPQGPKLWALMKQSKPVVTWRTGLPATTDLRDHRTFVVPPLQERGTYLITASARRDFSEKNNRVLAMTMTVSPWVLVQRHEWGRRVDARLLDGEKGTPVANAEVRVFELDYQRGHHAVKSVRTDARGEVAFEADGDLNLHRSFLLVAGRGREALLSEDGFSLFDRGTEAEGQQRMLFFTDRSVYRPLQKIQWKVVTFAGSGARARYTTSPEQDVELVLLDANYQEVERRKVRTNAFGSAAGEFTIPAGRALGRWQVSSASGGSTSVLVEEYKRPTFEVSLKDAGEPLRLNRPATFRGEARYYFGLPVTAGTVRWRVHREPRFPWWWGRHGSMGKAQVVATGSSPLAEDGSFLLTFTPEADERASADGVTWSYRVEADATAEGGETRSATRAFRLGLVSVEAQVDVDEAFFRAGIAPQVRVSRATLDGAPQPGKGTWRLVELQQPPKPVLPAERAVTTAAPGSSGDEGPHVVTPGDVLSPRWNGALSAPEVLREWSDGAELARGEVLHDAEGNVTVKLPGMKPGAYRVRYETLDAFGQKATATREFLVAASSVPVAVPVSLLAERASAKVGETLRLLAFSGFDDMPLFLEIFQDSRLIERRMLTGKDSAIIDLPVTEALRGGFSVAVVGVRDHQFLQVQQHVSVPFDDKELKVEFASFRDTLRPGAKEKWRVTVKGPRDAKMAAGAAELLAYMYDQSLEQFAQHSPPSVATYYPSRMGAVDLRSSVGAARNQYLPTQGFARPATWDPPDADALRFDSFLGQPGGGVKGGVVGGVVGGMTAGALAGAPPPPPAPPPPGSDGLARKKMARKIGGRSADEGVTIDVGSTTTGVNVAGMTDTRAEAPPPPAEAPRSNFAETAFWIPQLLTGPDGAATLEFTVPDSVTAWSVWAHALTRDFQGGSARTTVRSVKELMVRPQVPRFLREGDQAVLEVVVNNAGKQPLQGTLDFDIQDAETEKSLLADFGVKAASQPFNVAPGKGTTLRFPITVPARVGQVAFRAMARAGNLSDGELRPLPVLPGRMHLAQSRFVTLRNADQKVMTFEDLRRQDDPSRVHEQLVVSVDTQLFYSVLQALPYLVEYPYECTEQTLNRFVSTGIVSSLFARYPAVAKMAKEFSARDTRLEKWDASDPNRKLALEETPWLQEARGGAEANAALVKVLDPEVARAQRAMSLDKLRKAQTSSGGFPWWSGGPPSPYMTLYIVHGLSRAAEYGVEVPPEMTRNAWGYLARHFRDEYAKDLVGKKADWSFITFLNYVASVYPDARYTGDALTADERQRMLAYSFAHWKEHSGYLKGQLALTLKRAGREKDARLVWDSVMDAAKTTAELGTSWAQEDRSWLWYNDTTETHAFALRVLTELQPTDARREGLVQWLLLDKKLGHWKSTRATAEAMYSLVKYLEQEGALGIREDARVTVGPRRVDFVFEPDTYSGKGNRVIVPGPEVGPAMSEVKVEKTSKGFAFASATWHFSTERLPEQDRGDFFQVSRRYFRRVKEGREVVLQPLAQGAEVKPGDEVEVQLSLRTKHAAEYVHLRDPRAAGLEPEAAVSQHKWDLGISWYEETRDSGTNFFFERLPAGEYTFKYRLRANMAGTFRVGPATIQSMYAPEFTAYSTGAVLQVR